MLTVKDCMGSSGREQRPQAVAACAVTPPHLTTHTLSEHTCYTLLLLLYRSIGQHSLSSVSVASFDSASLLQDSPPTSPRTNDSSSIYNKALDLSSIFDGYGKIGGFAAIPAKIANNIGNRLQQHTATLQAHGDCCAV